MEMFDEYLTQYQFRKNRQGKYQRQKRTSLTAVRILGICEKINEELQSETKVICNSPAHGFYIIRCGNN